MQYLVRLAAIGVVATSMLFELSFSADALVVTPVHVEMSSVGAGSRSQITVTNDGGQVLPMEVILKSVALDENGERKLSTAKDEFLVFPPQALIQPGGTQVFRLQWVGEPDLPESKSFVTAHPCASV